MRNPRRVGPPPALYSPPRVLIGLAALAAAGCGGGNGPVPIDDLVARMQAAMCHASVACGIVPDTATCNASLSVTIDSSVLSVVASVKRGTTRYDGSLAQQCLDQIASLPCPTPPPSLEVCEAVFRGTIATGGACMISEECISQSCVYPSSCKSTCCTGTCSPGRGVVPLGAACGGLDSTFCSSDAFCKNGVCVAQVPVGSHCDDQDLCVAGSSCQSTGSATICTADFPAHGAKCTLGWPCQRSDDYCDPTSVRCVRRKLPGASCDGIECVAYANCVNGSCTAFPGPGASCFDASGQPILNCLGDLICIGDVCALPPPLDACGP
jgi:hypothetical protein